MKKKPRDQRDWHEKRTEGARGKRVAPESTNAGAQGRSAKGGVPETPGSRATFPQRTRKPREVGLANEVRPGLGSRAYYADPSPIPDKPPKEAKSGSKPQATPRAYEEPRPEPREQPPDSMAHEEERSTGVSGHMGNT
jgi:hypothetical protein